MNNKNEKTFADLFSNVTSDNQEEKEIHARNQEKKPLEKKSTITFDNLFDQAAAQNTAPEEKIDFNLFNKQSGEISEENINKKEEMSPKEPILFNTSLVESSILEKNIFQGKETLLTKKEETSFEENPFFTKQKDSEEASVQNINNFQTKEEIPLKKEEKPFEENPFFTKQKDSEEASVQNINNFQTKEKIPPKKEEKPIEENPFFTKKEIKEQTPNITNNPESSQIEEQPQEQKTKSSSPFFQDEVTEKSNPLLQTKLNLIENEQQQKKISKLDPTTVKHYDVKIVKKKEPLFKFILGVISYAVFIWLLLIGITLLIYVLDIKIRAAKGDYSSPTYNAYVVLTGSMLPEIQVKDVVITKKVKAETLNEGDIITFASADTRFLGTIITHRIIKKNPSNGTEGFTFQTQGDNNNVADSALVPEKNIYGKVILKIPKLGYLQEFLASDGGWIIVILIPCLTVISYDIVKLIKGLKRKKYKNIKVQK